ncbi:hypothetical protein GCM10027422_44620 [Hymenobacter arcticus]
MSYACALLGGKCPGKELFICPLLVAREWAVNYGLGALKRLVYFLSGQFVQGWQRRILVSGCKFGKQYSGDFN